MKRGEFLVKMIEEKGFNTMSLSKASGVPYTTIRSMIERNLSNASIDNVLKICRVLGIEAEAFADPDAWLAKQKEKGKQDDIETIAAHHEGEDWTKEELEEIEKFKEFIRMRRKMKQEE